jgi:amino acid transporter
MKKLPTVSVFGLAMLITVSIDSIRNLPAIAVFGSHLIFFFVLSVLLFLVPVALVSAELSSQFKKEGGIYHWVNMALGSRWAFLAVWLQWINTVVWYPTMLSFLAATIAYLIHPAWVTHYGYLVGVILGVYWALTFISLHGLSVATRFASIAGVLGMIIPMVLLIALGLWWVISGAHRAIDWHPVHWVPQHLAHSQEWLSLTGIMTCFLGIELAMAHIRDVPDAQAKFPPAIFISVVIIAVTLLFGALSIAMIIPSAQINLMSGVVSTVSYVLIRYHLSFLLPVFVGAIVLGGLGGMINWVISPAKGLLQAAEAGYLPPFFQQENRHHMPTRILLTQAVLVTALCVVFVLLPTVNGIYWLLTDLSTELYMMMYALMFVAALVIHYRVSTERPTYRIPGGAVGKWVCCLMGLVATTATLIAGFIPPAVYHVAALGRFQLLFLAGLVMMLLPLFFFYRYRAKRT